MRPAKAVGHGKENLPVVVLGVFSQDVKEEEQC